MVDQQSRTSQEVIAALVSLYQLAETHMLFGVSEILQRVNRTLLNITPTMPTSVAVEHAQFNQLQLDTAMPKVRRLAERLVQLLGTRSPTLVDTLVKVETQEAYEEAGLSASFSVPLGQRAAELVKNELNHSLRSAQAKLLRWPDDLYRELTQQGVIAQVLDNGLTPAQAQAQTFQAFTERGVTGFVDKAGRNWNLASYVEMAVRTGAQRAFNDTHLATMQAFGIELFTVDDDGNPCPICQPWQGKVLSVAPDPRADATIEEATAKGLFHPNCRHTLIKWVESLHPRVANPWTPADQQRYDDSQKQRRLERQVRQAKLQQATAIDAETRKAAAQKVRKNQAALKQHVDNTDLLRNSRREQPNLRLDTIAS